MEKQKQDYSYVSEKRDFQDDIQTLKDSLLNSPNLLNCQFKS